jgi:tetratricopeptide (TPR) repeat protein
MQGLRKRLLETALGYYERFTRQQADDPELQAAVAEAIERVAQITGQIGSPDVAAAGWRRAGAIWESLAKAHPGEAKYVVGESRTQRELARLNDSFADLSLAQALIEPLAGRQGDDALNDELAALYQAIGRSHRMTLAGFTAAEELANYRKALAIRERLVARHPDDLKARSKLASLAMNVGFYHARKGEIDQALTLHARARDLYERVVREQPPGFGLDAQRELARAHQNIAFAKASDGRDAEPDYQRAIDGLERLARESPAVAEYQSSVISVHGELARHLNNQGRHTGAARAARAGIEAASRYFSQFTMAKTDLHDVVSFRTNPLQLAIACQSLGELDEAARAYQTALDLSHLDPRGPVRSLAYSYNRGTALVFDNLAKFERRRGRLDLALAAARHAENLALDLTRAAPGQSESAWRLWHARSLVADILSRAGRHDEALTEQRRNLADLQALAAARPNEDVYPYLAAVAQVELAVFLRIAGSPAEALKLARQAIPRLKALPRPDADDLHVTARAHALIGSLAPRTTESADDAQSHLDAALSLLQRAVAAGYHDAGILSTDHALDPLRSRPDFQLLLLDVSFPREPFAR